METVHSRREIQLQMKAWRAEGKRIGFVPTMGALHEGHLSLVREAQEQCDKVVVSIFVNPTQFNDPTDLDRYPRTLERDTLLLQRIDLDLIFTPLPEEVYTKGLQAESFDFGSLGEGMEAKNRPGHFDGVATVLSHLFDLCTPDRAFFGEKDFQQLQVVRALVELQKRPIEIVGCSIFREANGLAMSSRNELLSDQAKGNAGMIFQALNELRNNSNEFTIERLKADFLERLNGLPNAEVEYIEICDERNLLEVNELNSNEHLRAFTVVRFEGVRLLDNLSLFP